ncbi:hypothetical protein CRYUN_Cryun39dG0027700 [Craigia yunnanensis]
MDATTQLQEELKQEVRGMVTKPMDKPSQKLKLIDAIQRLGVAYHFEKEIEDALENIFRDCNSDGNDLYITSLRFRLLREHGFNVQCESFNKFKDEKGNFKKSLISDVKGSLELFEAAHLRVHGENILEEALAFTSFHLKLAENMVDYPLSAQVAHARKFPIRRSLPRLEARRYIPIYQATALHDETLLKFSKLDFNLLQHLHKKEICEIYRWWKDLEFSYKLPFVRDRLVEGYFWILGVYFEPRYSLARKMVTKVIAMTSIIDDIHDAYGTLEELELFSSAIERWDISCMDQLPDYMQLIYKALLDVYEEMEKVMSKEGNLYRVQHAKEAMKRQVQAYFGEAKWLHENYIPTLEEYMSIAVKSSGYGMLLMTSLVGMGDIVPKQAFIWASNDPKIVRASAIISRLMNDIAGHKIE